MELSRDLFLTDGRTPYLSLTLASRDLDSHRLLTGLTPDERMRLLDVLTNAASVLSDLLRRAHARQEPEAGTSTFGCGT